MFIDARLHYLNAITEPESSREAGPGSPNLPTAPLAGPTEGMN